MRHVSLIKLLATIAVSFTATNVAYADQPAKSGADRENKPTIPFSFAISGGVSLGAYEAGLNWGVVKYMKLHKNDVADPKILPPKLMSVSGASAGRINALMTSVSWCVDKTKIDDGAVIDNVSDNLFRNIWLKVGIDTLLPKDPHKYLPDDGLLTRSAFTKELASLKNILAADVFKSDCSIPFGLMVTRTEPLDVTVNSLDIENQRFMIPVLFKVNNEGHGEFFSYEVNPYSPRIGNVIYLQGNGEKDADGNLKLATDTVIDAVLASSAFPVAVGRVSLNYCIKDSQAKPADGDAVPIPKDKCPDDYRPNFDKEAVDFVDGGVFDNIPLGSAKVLGEPLPNGTYIQKEMTAEDMKKPYMIKEQAREGRPFSYLYIDPDRRRKFNVKNTERPANSAKAEGACGESSPNPCPKTYGLESQLGFLGGAITTARKYELYRTLTNGDWTSNLPELMHNQYIIALNNYIKDHGGSIKDEWRKGDPDQEQCRSVFAANGEPNVGNVKLMRRCLLADSRTLVLEYLPYAAEIKSRRTDEELKEFRETLIKRSEQLAAKTFKQPKFSYEIYTTDPIGDRTVEVSSRFFPVVGNYLAAFGAFFDQPLREFDYYTGVYDSVNMIAEYLCSDKRLKEKAQGNAGAPYGTCLNTMRRHVFDELTIESDNKAVTVYRFLATRENKITTSDWLPTGVNFVEDKNLVAIGKSLEAAEGFNPDHYATSVAKPEYDLNKLIRALSNNGYAPSSNEMKYLVDNADQDSVFLYSQLVARASERLAALEAAESNAKKTMTKEDKTRCKTSKSDFSALVDIAALATSTAFPDASLLKISPATV